MFWGENFGLPYLYIRFPRGSGRFSRLWLTQNTMNSLYRYNNTTLYRCCRKSSSHPVLHYLKGQKRPAKHDSHKGGVTIQAAYLADKKGRGKQLRAFTDIGTSRGMRTISRLSPGLWRCLSRAESAAYWLCECWSVISGWWTRGCEWGSWRPSWKLYIISGFVLCLFARCDAVW